MIQSLDPIGLKKTSVGFEALVTTFKKAEPHLLRQLHIERPTLEDIMYYTVTGSSS